MLLVKDWSGVLMILGKCLPSCINIAVGQSVLSFLRDTVVTIPVLDHRIITNYAQGTVCLQSSGYFVNNALPCK